jgi:hypothetical protein
MIDGGKIGNLLERARTDFTLRMQLFHCPEVAARGLDLTEEELTALRRGDLSGVELDGETLTWGRKVFSEIPNAGDMPPEHAAVEVFALRGSGSDPCA